MTTTTQNPIRPLNSTTNNTDYMKAFNVKQGGGPTHFNSNNGNNKNNNQVFPYNHNQISKIPEKQNENTIQPLNQIINNTKLTALPKSKEQPNQFPSSNFPIQPLQKIANQNIQTNTNKNNEPIQGIKPTTTPINSNNVPSKPITDLTLKQPAKDKTTVGTIKNDKLQSFPIENSKQVKTVEESKNTIEVLPMRNARGSNSCFINVVIQLLYQTSIFRKKLIQCNPFRSTQLNYLKKLLTSYHDIIARTDSKIIGEIMDASGLRKELSLLFKGYHMLDTKSVPGDPVDVFLNIMTIFHAEKIKAPSLSDDDSKPCHPHQCLSHQHFALKLVEYTSCMTCNFFTNNAYDLNNYVYEVYTYELFNQIKTLKLNSFHQKLFEIIKRTNSIYDPISSFCKCIDKSHIIKRLIISKSPVYLIMNCTWSVFRPSLVDICNMYAMIPLRSNSAFLFTMSEETNSHIYVLNSMITFYNGHYTFCFRGNSDKKWYFCDDMTITSYDTWTLLMNYLVRNHYHPQLLCYEKKDNSSLRMHISQEDYDVLYKQCYNSDTKDDKTPTPAPISMPIPITINDNNNNMTSSFIDRQKSGMVSRRSFIFRKDDNNQQQKQCIESNDEAICSFCHKEMKPNETKCNKCQSNKNNKDKKMNNIPLTGTITKGLDFDFELMNIVESVSIEPSPSNSFNKSKENQKEFSFSHKKANTNEAEIFNDDNGSVCNIKKKSTKEIMLSQEKGQSYIKKNSSINKIENIKKEEYSIDHHRHKTAIQASISSINIINKNNARGKEYKCSKCNKKTYEKDLLKQATTMGIWCCQICRQQNSF